jgi:hypothetical protein
MPREKNGGIGSDNSAAFGTVPQNYGRNMTILGAVRVQGIQAVMTVDGPTDTAVFRA